MVLAIEVLALSCHLDGRRDKITLKSMVAGTEDLALERLWLSATTADSESLCLLRTFPIAARLPCQQLFRSKLAK